MTRHMPQTTASQLLTGPPALRGSVATDSSSSNGKVCTELRDDGARAAGPRRAAHTRFKGGQKRAVCFLRLLRRVWRVVSAALMQQ